jgi:hypothetical protein
MIITKDPSSISFRINLESFPQGKGQSFLENLRQAFHKGAHHQLQAEFLPNSDILVVEPVLATEAEILLLAIYGLAHDLGIHLTVQETTLQLVVAPCQ